MMGKDNKKIEEENLSKDKEKKEAAKVVAAGLEWGFHTVNLANKEKKIIRMTVSIMLVKQS